MHDVDDNGKAALVKPKVLGEIKGEIISNSKQLGQLRNTVRCWNYKVVQT